MVAEGLFKAKRLRILSDDPVNIAEVEPINDKIGRGSAMLRAALMRTLKDEFENYAAERCV